MDRSELKSCIARDSATLVHILCRCLSSLARGDAVTSVREARNRFHFPQTSFRNSFPNTVWFIVSV